MGKSIKRILKSNPRASKGAARQASRTHNRINVSSASATANAAAAPADYHGMLPDVLAILNDNTRLRGEVVRLSAENARLKMAAER